LPLKKELNELSLENIMIIMRKELTLAFAAALLYSGK